MKLKNNIMEVLMFVCMLTLLYYSSEPIYHGDTHRYLNGSLLDPPMYSSVTFVLYKLFESYKSVVIFQTILIIFGIVSFTRTISNIFNLNIIFKIIISLFLFLPIIQFYNNLLTEPLSYSFSLLFISFSIKLIFNFNRKNLISVVIFACALLLTRNQFIFLYPLILILFLGIFVINDSKKIFAKLLVSSFIFIFVAHNSLIFLNTYINQKYINSDHVNKKDSWKESLTYVSLGPSYFLFIDAIYISNRNDVVIFKNQNIQETLTKIFDKMDEKKSLAKYYDGRGHFGKSLVNIRDYSNDLLIELANQENRSLSSLKREISIKLISSNFGSYLKQIFKKFYDSTWLFIFIPFFMFIVGLTVFLKYKSELSLLIIFLSSFAIANHSVVYIFGRIQPRYLIYSDFILLIFIFVLLNKLLEKKN